MRFTVIDVPQGSPEWLQARAGLLTGSRADAVLAGKTTAARRNYKAQLITERLTGQPAEEGFVSEDMKRGTALEPDARAAYEAHTGLLVETTGFLRHAEHPMGCSLDGHTGDFDGIVELKVPKSATHIDYWMGGDVPAKYLPQIRHNLLVSGAAFCDFVSFDPRFPEDLRLFVKRVYALELGLPDYEREAMAFLKEVEADLAALLKKVA